MRTSVKNRVLVLFAFTATISLITQSCLAFSQHGVGSFMADPIPMGHEWITRQGLIEMIGGDPIWPQIYDPSDPRDAWKKGKAKNLDFSGANVEAMRIVHDIYDEPSYQSHYRALYSAIIGERWVDIGGFSVLKAVVPGGTDCFNPVVQDSIYRQYDHYLRKWNDTGASGGIQALNNSRNAFIEYFIAAAKAPRINITVWDGGASYNRVEVNLNYFLFGRAAHVVQDSFSSEHAVRVADDNYETLRQIKSYHCTPGAEQHDHSVFWDEILYYKSGDAIWLPGTGHSSTSWSSYKPSNIKVPALVAIEATKDLWAAFIRTMAIDDPVKRAETARQEANGFAYWWLRFDETEVRNWYVNGAHRDAKTTYVLDNNETGNGQTVAVCMKNNLDDSSGNLSARATALENKRQDCLFNILPEAAYSHTPAEAALHYDPNLSLPFNWAWKPSWVTRPAPNGQFCCWNRLIQACSSNQQCDVGGEGCIASQTPTAAFGSFQCSTCESRGLKMNDNRDACVPK